MESLEKARKDAFKAVEDAKATLDSSIQFAAENLVMGVAVASSAYNDVCKTSSELVDQGKVGSLNKIRQHHDML